MSKFATNSKGMLRQFVHYFEEYYNQDSFIFSLKTLFGVAVLNIPQYLPEVQGGAKLLSTILALGSGSIGFLLLCFKLYDEVKKRIERLKTKKR